MIKILDCKNSNYLSRLNLILEKRRTGSKTNTDIVVKIVNDDFFKEAVKTWKDVRPLFHKSQSFPIENEAYWMKPNAHSEMYHDEELMSNAIPMLEYADFEIEAKHKEVAVNHFYDYIHAEQDMAGEMLQTKTFAN